MFTICLVVSTTIIDTDIFIKLCERLASLEAKLDMHFLEHNRIWLLLIPIIAGVIINVLQNITISRKIGNGGIKK